MNIVTRFGWVLNRSLIRTSQLWKPEEQYTFVQKIKIDVDGMFVDLVALLM